MSRDLPMPASPESSTTWPSPLLASTSAAAAIRILLRARRGRSRPLACSASKRLSTELARSAAQARAGPAMPLRSFGPRSSSSNRLPRSLRVPSAMTTVSGSAIACRRAARFGVSPTTPRSCASPDPIEVADHDQPGRDADPHVQRRAGRGDELRRRLDDGEPGLHGALGVMLVRLRIAEIGEHAVAHVFGDETAVSRSIDVAQQR